MTNELLLEALRRMTTIRFTENAIAEDFRANKIFSFYHSSVGQEAVSVGTSMALKPGDKVFGTHRSHAAYLAQGGDLYKMLAEIYGKEDGCCNGYGGSMHMVDRAAGFAGSTPILGSAVPIALGSAFAQKARGERNITVVYIGDGATEEGAFYESVNLAAVFKLPIIIVVEDNLFAVNTPSSDRRGSRFNWKQLIQGLGVNYSEVDGNSFYDMYIHMLSARELCLNSEAPSVIRAITFRDMAHSGPIKDESVRVLDQVDVRKSSDPIDRLKTMLRFGGVTELTIDTLSCNVLLKVVNTLESVKGV